MQDMPLFTIVITLFLIMDPIGNIPSFLHMTQGIHHKRLKFIVLREMLIALAAMFFFNYLGEFIFKFLDLSENSVRIASGIILFLIAIKILFPSSDSLRSNLPVEEPFIIPLAIPLIAGPSLLATIMLFARLESCQSQMLTAILLAWMAAATVLTLAPRIQRLLGNNGLMACERLMGMILVMIAIQRFMEGIQAFIKAHAQH